MRRAAASEVRAALAELPDPEIPVLTIEDLGILRDVSVDEAGAITVTITPTYSGCPAMDAIRADIGTVLRRHGWRDVVVRTSLAPPWSSDWISEAGRRKLADFGIAPPGPVPASRPVFVELSPPPRVRCPLCGSADVRETSRFGSTACKALWVCDTCLEPFDYFKAI
jgi:ring-1,2-phenylacetyl-CoA epoxidase subunit PaaD